MAAVSTAAGFVEDTVAAQVAKEIKRLVEEEGEPPFCSQSGLDSFLYLLYSKQICTEL